jgi:N6-adenosine-specific RNA methylase IME4
MAELKLIDVSLLDDHPQNPRIWYRDDVIDGIVANLDGEWPKEHALIVRPFQGRYQLVAGHTRKRAAEKKGLTKVWCWVKEMTDHEAFMVLATSNSQGELEPVELAQHVFASGAKAGAGRGKKGGLSEYARQIGKQRQYITQLWEAGEVMDAVKSASQLADLRGKAQHLAAIHALPKACWPACVEWLGANDIPAVKVQEKVKIAKAFMEDHGISDAWVKTYLKATDCAAAVFCGVRPAVFSMLGQLATEVLESLADHEDLSKQWMEWLLANVGKDSWDVKKVQAKRSEIEEARLEREALPPQQDYSVILADPPWKYDFAETDNRQIENQYPTADVDDICEHINAAWAPLVSENAVLFLWATAPKLREAIKVMEAWGFEYKTHACWDKETMGMGYWFRGQHELLLVGTQGDMSPPEQSARVSSVFREKRSKHSKKPVCVYEAIESMFPNAKRFEMYQRTKRSGWDGGGLEA